MRLEWVRRFSAILRKLFSQKPKKSFRPLIFALAVCVFSVLIYTSVSMYMFSATIGSRGTVKTVGVGVYWDGVCSKHVSYIDWGIVDPGSQENVRVYVRNEGNVPVVISLDAFNWDPLDASSYITLSWDYLGQPVEPEESIEVTLTLQISSSIENVGNFDFDIEIAGIG